jgi:FKBP-type peptidyl-prolyl cis-trans isomerase FkpA
MQKIISRFLIYNLCCLLALNTFAKESKETITAYPISDSIKPTGILQKINIQAINTKKEVHTGITVDGVSLFLESEKKEKEIGMSFPKNAIIMALGVDVGVDKPWELEWEYNWQLNENYQLYIATATDSAQNFILYSGYIYLPKEDKWKLIGSCKIEGKWGYIKSSNSFTTKPKKNPFEQNIAEVWVQRKNGSFKNLLYKTQATPVLAPFSNIDSTAQFSLDSANIYTTLQKNTSEKYEQTEGVYYTIKQQGNGNKIALTDTVSVFYKGYVFNTTNVFDETKDKPASFPLNRLIKGWQIAIPKVNVGGIVKIIIPSGLSYSIRTRSPKIPPNSILVFEITVLEAKPKLL